MPLGLGAAVAAFAVHAASVTTISPSGEVAEVRQISMRFNEAVVAQGDPRLPAPYALTCNGAAPAGNCWAMRKGDTC